MYRDLWIKALFMIALLLMIMTVLIFLAVDENRAGDACRDDGGWAVAVNVGNIRLGDWQAICLDVNPDRTWTEYGEHFWDKEG